MGVSLIVLLVHGYMPSLGIGSDKVTDKEVALLQGVWQVKELEAYVDTKKGGTLPTNAELKKWRWVIKDNTLTWIYPSDPSERETFILDPAQNPKWIDLTNTVVIQPIEGQNKVREPVRTEKWTFYGIYELNGNILRVCLPMSRTGSKIRPVAFSGSEGSGSVVWVLERVQKKDK
jgi:uncharacterized protein (TIGR03067 family)